MSTNQMSFEPLIAKLKADLRPAAPYPMRTIALCFSLVFMIYVLAMVYFIPAREDLRHAVANWSYLGLLSLPLLLMIWLPFQTLNSKLKSPIVRVSGILLYIGFAFVFARGTLSGEAMSLQSADWSCAYPIFYLGLPALTFSLILAAFIPGQHLGFYQSAIFVSFTIGALVVNAHCNYEGAGHFFFGHALIPLFLYALIFAPLVICGNALLRFVQARRMVQLRRRILLR